MKTININGKDFTLEELTSLIENSKNENPMLEVYKFHKTTEEEFDELYKNIPVHIKAHTQEKMVVNFYNKGKSTDFNDCNEYKYYPCFYLGGNFKFDFVSYYDSYAYASSRLGFLREKDCKEAVVKFFHIYKLSRNVGY